MDLEIRNAIITDATITTDDHGLLTAWVYLDYGGSGQGFGGFSLYLPESFKHSSLKEGGAYAGHFIWRVMEIAGVSEWSKLKGKTIRAKAGHSNVEAIGHIVKNDWFNPSEDFKKIEAAKSV